MTVNDDVMTTPDPGRTRVHEHAWTTESAHRTSIGRLRYVICPACGTRRVDLQPHPERPPAALSVPVPSPALADQSRAGGRRSAVSARE
ncbi:hypothetical protein [Nakamurella sp.]|uniref:hypothetical protein n=1 Tax=Nakamurella sp. TaxID=1869182 RepID=UPI003B3BA102